MSRPLPAVSVLMPVHDAAPWLGRAVRSVLRQSLGELELVAVDDGSTDASAQILARWAARDERVRVIRLPRREGLVTALNIGLDAVRAPLTARCDADDLNHRDRLARQATMLAAEPGVMVAGCRVASFPRRTLGEGFSRYDAWVNGILTPAAHRRERYVESTLPHPSAMMRTIELRALGGYRDRGWPEDVDLWLRVHAAGGGFRKAPEVLYFWRDHPGRASRVDPRYARAAFLRAKAHFLARDPFLATKRVVIWGAGAIGRQLGRLLREEGVAVAAHVDIDPRKIGGSRRGAPVIAPDGLHAHAGTPLIAAVGARGARAIIRADLGRRGYIEGRDFLVVA